MVIRTLALSMLLAACAQTPLLDGMACAQDSDCDPGDLCASGNCAAALRESAFSVTPAVGNVTAEVGVRPAARSFALDDETQTGHSFDVKCSGGAVPTPASGRLNNVKTISISVQAPPVTRQGTKVFTCNVTSPQTTSAHATYSLQVTATDAADFAIAPAAPSLSIAQGDSGAVAIEITGSGGFAGDVALSVSGAPAGSTAVITPTTVVGSGSASLAVDSGSASVGSSTLTITGVSGTHAHTATVSLAITAASGPDFSLTATPASVTVAQGAHATATLQATGRLGFSGSIALSASGLPAGVTATFAPASVAAGVRSTVTLSAGTAAAAGTYSISLDGQSGALSRSTPLELVVQGANGTGVGPGGGTVDLLDFVMTGDTRPPNCDQTSSYPTAIHDQIIKAMAAAHPQFGLDLGDHMYVCSQTLAVAQAQMNLYLHGLQSFSPLFLMTMGNHECEGGKDCSANTADVNYSTFLAALKQVSQQSKPNYALQIQTRHGRVTLVVVADNSFSAADQQWLEATLSDADKNSKYTIIAKHHPVSGSRTGPQAPWNIISKHKYTLLLMAHNHDYQHTGSSLSSAKQVICGLGGANASHTGYCRVQQQADGSLLFTEHDANGNPGDSWTAQPQ